MRSIFKQQGMSMLTFFALAVLAAFLLLTFIKLVPPYVEYISVNSSLKRLANNPATISLPDSLIQNEFNKHAEINDITSVRGEEMEIEEVAGVLVLRISYQKVVPIWGSLNFLFDFKASSQ